MLTVADIEAAWARIRPHVRRTPVLEAEADPSTSVPAVNLKLEFLQHAGSFKSRGAFNNLLSRPIPAAGVAAASGGNHGVAVAHAARELGHVARIFVPVISSPVKIAAIEARGADVVVGGERYNDALGACETYAAQSGALSVHAYDSWDTIAGQGTLGLEWLEQVPDLDTVLVAVGGGGLISGIARALDRRVRVVGVEPSGSCCLHASLAAGRPVDVAVDSIAADSLGARNCGDRVFEVAKSNVDRVVLVPDAAIRQAQRLLWSRFRIAAEPGGATAFAALLGDAYRPAAGERVGVLLCGGNVAPESLA